MAFIVLRRCRNSRGYYLVESYRDGDGRSRKRTLRYLGRERDGTDTLAKAVAHWRRVRRRCRREWRAAEGARKEVLGRRLAAADARLGLLREHARRAEAARRPPPGLCVTLRLLVSGATPTVRDLKGRLPLGHLIVPGAFNGIAELLASGLPWAADNGAFAGFDAAAFCRMLGRIAGQPGCLFVACPDVVGDAAATAGQFARWQPVIRDLGLPVALVLQDGQDGVGVPWESIDALFIGGSTGFKLGPAAAALAGEGKRRGKWAHCGRVNTRQRVRHAYAIGCDSFDGSGFSRWPGQRIPLAARWLEQIAGRNRRAGSGRRRTGVGGLLS